ncbi:MAG: pallilysin-related adhesin [Spirochaetales bacterium]|nr:pallilysin-related adhesin [Spirochaetales bacterium]
MKFSPNDLKKKAVYLLSIVSFGLFAGCAPQTHLEVLKASVQPSATDAASATEMKLPMESPRLEIPLDKRLLSAQSVSLNQTAIEEQILFLQSRNNLSLPLDIRVIDFDQNRNTYYYAWEGTCLASANEPFTYEFQDLLGDHNKELIVRGIDLSGKPTLDVYQQISLPGGHGIQLKNIFSIALKGTISITGIPRLAAYDTGTATMQSFPIVTEQADPRAPTTSVLQTTYTFQAKADRYLKTGSQTVALNEQNDAALHALYAGDNQYFVHFLQGPWLKEDTNKTGLHPMIFIDARNKNFTFATDHAQEVYHWDLLSRTMNNGIYLVGNNQLINLINVQLNLTVTSVDTIDVNVQGTPSWSGTYHRLSYSVLAAEMHHRERALSQQKGPSGVYLDETGDEVRFALPLVEWHKGSKVSHYEASLFRWNGQDYLELKLLHGTNEPTTTYLYQTSEEKTSSRIIRNLTLQPGKLSLQRWTSDRLEPVRLEQTEAYSSGSGSNP